MTLERLAVLVGCAMGMVCAQAADPLVPSAGQRQVYSVMADGGGGDGRSFAQRLDGPRDTGPASRTAREAMGPAADSTAMPLDDDPSASESPNLWLMLLGLLATGLVLLRRRPI